MSRVPLTGTPMVEYEQWENASQGLVVLRKLDSLGQITEERVPGGRKVQITPQERRHNQEQAATEALDVFTNGTLRPVRLIDKEEDTEFLQSNVNAMSEDSMRDLYRGPLREFKTRVDAISNPIALQRLLEIASDESVDATIRQVETVKARLEKVRPSPTETNPSLAAQSPRGEGTLHAVTPR
jgi:hypothetical protein